MDFYIVRLKNANTKHEEKIVASQHGHNVLLDVDLKAWRFEQRLGD